MLRRPSETQESLFGSWDVRSPYRSGSLKTAAKELVEYKLYLEGIQQIIVDFSITN
jgi:hypothetical protein